MNHFNTSYELRTVCEVTREIFDIISENKEKIGDLYDAIFLKLTEQMTMQKKMDAKLRFYSGDTYEGMYSINEGFKEKQKKRNTRETLR